MNFVEKLNSGEYDEKNELNEYAYDFQKRVFKGLITDYAKEARKNGKRSVKGYIVNVDVYGTRILEDIERRTGLYGLPEPRLELFRKMLGECLKELGFHNYSVRIVDFQAWKTKPTMNPGKEKVVKSHIEKTLWIEYYW